MKKAWLKTKKNIEKSIIHLTETKRNNEKNWLIQLETEITEIDSSGLKQAIRFHMWN